jgi:hypothetical protein
MTPRDESAAAQHRECESLTGPCLLFQLHAPRLAKNHTPFSSSCICASYEPISARWANTIACPSAHTDPTVFLCVLVPPPSEAHQKLNTNPSPRTGSQRPQAPSSVGPSRGFPKVVTRRARMSDSSYCLSLISRLRMNPTSLRHSSFPPTTMLDISVCIYRC